MTPSELQRRYTLKLNRLIDDYASEVAKGTMPDTTALRNAFKQSMVLSNLRGQAFMASTMRAWGQAVPKSTGEMPSGINSKAVRILAQRVPLIKQRANVLDEVYRQKSFYVAEQLGPLTQKNVETIKEMTLRFALGEGLAPQPVKGKLGLLEEAQRKVGNLTKFRLQTIFWTQTAQAYHDGTYEQQHDPDVEGAIVYREYLSARTETTRPSHRAMHGFLAPADDPTWERIWPLNGFNCKCLSPSPIFMHEARRRKLVDPRGAPVGRVYANKAQRELVETGSAEIGGKLYVFPDRGWDRPKVSVLVA